MDMRITLHLVRHGRTLWNEERRYLGHEDQGILAEGREQLLPLREELRCRHFVGSIAAISFAAGRRSM